MAPKFKVGDIVSDKLTVDLVVEVHEDHYVLKILKAISPSYEQNVGHYSEYGFDEDITADYTLDKESIWNNELKDIIND